MSFAKGLAAVSGSLVFAGAVFIGLIALIVLGIGGCNNWKRGQKLKDAHNRVKITAIGIQNYEQKVKIEKQKAQIRFISSTGVRRAQDEIAKTLTPLYIQWEAIQAQLAMASGQNHSVVYIPAGANGVPLVSTLGTQDVGRP